MRISNAEIKWLKGFTDEELVDYMEQYPERREHAEEFKKRYTYNYRKNKWIRN
jgi:hypothetical protein